MNRQGLVTRGTIARRIPAIVLAMVVFAWVRGCDSWSISNRGGFFFNPNTRTYTGVQVLQTGRAPNGISISSFTDWHGFIEIRGVDAGVGRSPVRVVVWPHWLFALIAIPPGVWWLIVELQAAHRRRRAEMGLCVSCGYTLGGIETNICPECGTAIKAPPFAVVTGPVTAVEGIREYERGIVRYTLTINTRPGNPSDALAPYVRTINEIMLRWVRLRDAAGEKLVFAFATIPLQREAESIAWVLKLVNQNVPESRIIQSLGVEVVIQNARGKELKRLGIGSQDLR